MFYCIFLFYSIINVYCKPKVLPPDHIEEYLQNKTLEDVYKLSQQYHRAAYLESQLALSDSAQPNLVLAADGAVLPCDPNWYQYSGNNCCYRKTDAMSAWYGGTGLCKALHPEAQMASFHSQAESEFVCKKYPSIHAWTGLSQTGTPGVWTYTDGTPDWHWFFAQSSTMTPESSCVEMLDGILVLLFSWSAKKGQTQPYSCTEEIASICKYCPKETTTTSTTTTTTTTKTTTTPTTTTPSTTTTTPTTTTTTETTTTPTTTTETTTTPKTTTETSTTETTTTPTTTTEVTTTTTTPTATTTTETTTTPTTTTESTTISTATTTTETTTTPTTTTPSTTTTTETTTTPTTTTEITTTPTTTTTVTVSTVTEDTTTDAITTPIKTTETTSIPTTTEQTTTTPITTSETTSTTTATATNPTITTTTSITDIPTVTTTTPSTTTSTQSTTKTTTKPITTPTTTTKTTKKSTTVAETAKTKTTTSSLTTTPSTSPKPISCTSKCQRPLVEFNGKCYKMCRGSVKFGNSCELCGGTVVTISSKELNNFISRVFGANDGTTSQIWIGNTETSGYLNWAEGQPSKPNDGLDYCISMDLSAGPTRGKYSYLPCQNSMVSSVCLN